MVFPWHFGVSLDRLYGSKSLSTTGEPALEIASAGLAREEKAVLICQEERPYHVPASQSH